jgi:hypothetical protein
MLCCSCVVNVFLGKLVCPSFWLHHIIIIMQIASHSISDVILESSMSQKKLEELSVDSI